MPQDGFAGQRRFADVVRGEQRDVGADEELGQVEQPRVADEAHPEGVAGDEFGAQVLAVPVGVPGLQPGDVLARLGDEIPVEYVAEDRVAVAVVVLEGPVDFRDHHVLLWRPWAGRPSGFFGLRGPRY